MWHWLALLFIVIVGLGMSGESTGDPSLDEAAKAAAKVVKDAVKKGEPETTAVNKATDAANKVEVAVKKGWCHSDTNNPSWYILKTSDKPGWVKGEECWATDGTKTLWGQKPCYGGPVAKCKSYIGPNNTVKF